MFKKQFLGPRTWKIVGAIAASHILAFFIRESPVEGVVLLLAFVGVFILSQRSLLTGLAIAFIEIFVGGHGHLLDVDLLGFSVSLRMVLFGAVMSAWLWNWWRGEIKLHRDVWRELPFVILLIALVGGFIQGVFANGAGAAFDDVNAYMTLAYLLPVMSIEWTSKSKRVLLQAFAGSAIWIIGFSLLLLYVFTHVDGDTLNVLYTFVRDSRLAEVTLQVDYDTFFYRVFMPAQSTAVMVLLLSWGAMLFSYRSERLPDLVGWAAIGSLAVLFMSMSRSFLLGAFAAMCVMWVVALLRERRRWVTLKRSIWMSVCAAVALVAVYALVTVPIPTRPDLTDASFYETSSQTGRGEAVVSRWALLDPLMQSISQSPLVGQGFGATITYESSDPRIIDETGGEYTTYRFEWGWHDIWLKMGLLGIIAFAVYFAILVLSARYHASKHSQSWLVIGLASSVFALFVAHTFSPYLNHPIGVMWMLFVLPFLDTRGWGKVIEGRLRGSRILDRQIKAVVTSDLAK
ncbi:hypothetical protein HON52_04240 [Candidatus Uhrbacteria bacterium]|jgi:hypothetical protein|nr:hypothetical protein [Candidatus Uhrbacteria bacterium]